MNDQQARQTPIIDLLRDIPADARMVYEVTPTHHQSIPVGVLAKNAADEIERLRAERDEHARWRQKLADDLHDRESEITELRRQISEAETDARRYRDWLRGGANIPPESNRWPRWEVRCWNGRFWNTLFAEAMDAAIDEAMGLTRPDEET